MSDLVSRLFAAIEATERQAEIAHPGPWAIHRDDKGTFVTYGGENRIVGQVYAGYDARFIIRNDPAAVLRRCESDRRLLKRLVEVSDPLYLTYSPGVDVLVEFTLKQMAFGYGISVEEETTGE